MKKLISIFIPLFLILNPMGAVGIESLNIPVTSEALALDNAGTALKNNASSNPANHPNSEFSGYGSRRWLDGFIGHSISYSFGERKPIKLVFETIKDEEVKHYGAVPQDNSLGNIPVSWYSIGIGVSHAIKGNQIGIELKPFINLLYKEKLYGISLNAGLMRTILDKLTFGFTIKNIGWVGGDLEGQELPLVLQGGASANMMKQKLNLFGDIRYINNSLEEIIGFHFSSSSLDVFSSISIRGEGLLLGAGFSLTFRNWTFQYGLQKQMSSALGIPQFFNLNRRI